MRLIDADALMRKLTVSPCGTRYREYDCDNFPTTLTLAEVKKMVRNEPTVAKDNNVLCKPSDICGCGGKAILTDYTVEGSLKQYSVACETCFIGLPYGFDTPDDAWAAWRRAMGGPQPDPITGLAPCGCGGDAVRNGMSFFCAYVTSCSECGTLAWSKASQREADDNWNTSRGYTAPSRPGAKEQSHES